MPSVRSSSSSRSLRWMKRDVAVNEGRQLRAVGDDLLVGEDIGGVVRGAEGGLAVQIPGDEHAGGQLGRVDLVLVDEAVAHIGRAVRRDKAQLACRMAGERQYTEPGAVYVDVVLLGKMTRSAVKHSSRNNSRLLP